MTDDLSDKPANEKESPDLYKKAVKGGFWVIAARVLAQILSIGRYVLLMNILQIKDMGLLGISFLMIQTLNTFSNTGFNAALVQKKGESKSYLDTAWTVGVIRAFILFAILYFAAPVIVNLKDIPLKEASLTISVIRVLGLSFLIGSASNIGVIYFKKELQFHKQFILQTLPTLISIIVSVVLVLIYKNVWSLVIGRMSANVFRCIISYILHPFRPKFKFELDKAKELWGFGKWVFGATIIGFLLTQGDDFFVWVYIDATALALYQAAYKFSNIPATEITHVISQVSFPAYSKLQDDIPRLRDAYFKILQFSSCLSIPIAALIFILTPEFVTIFLKSEWHPMIPAMQILAIFGLLRSLGATTGSVFYALNKPNIGTMTNLAKLLLLAIIIYPSTLRWGIVGTSSAILLVGLFSQPINLFFINRLLKCNSVIIFRTLIIPFIAATLTLTLIILYKYFCPITNIIHFTIAALIGIVTYTLSLLTLDYFSKYGFFESLKDQIAILKK